METRRRTLVKTAGWQLLGLAVMAAVGALVTGSASIGGALAAINMAIGTVCYIGYERLWAHVAWGRQ